MPERRLEPEETIAPSVCMNEPKLDAPYALVVDDDALVRMAAVGILSDVGFEVLDAEHGDAAFALLQTRYNDVGLLFTDVHMPGQLDGCALAHKVCVSWSHIAIVVASGNLQLKPGMLPDTARFISKPFSAQVVHDHLQEILPHGRKPEPLKRKARAASRF